jgi:hypothetical protein
MIFFRIRQSDGEFFEKFGSSLRARVTQARESVTKTRVTGVDAACYGDAPCEEAQDELAAAEDSEEEVIPEEAEIFSDVVGKNVSNRLNYISDMSWLRSLRLLLELPSR